MEQAARCRRLDEHFAKPMFYVALASLLAFAVMLHFHERPEYAVVWWNSVAASALLWPIYVIEFVLAWRAGSARTGNRFWCCVLPPLRIAARDHETGQRVWFPQLSWQAVSRALRERLEQAGNVPMIAIAVLVLPLVALELKFENYINSHPTLAVLSAVANSLIWFAFAYEFLVMVSVAEKKIDYCKAHWLDIVIILLPVIAFLRVLRLGRLLRLQQLSRTYRMRGTAMRAWKALLVLNVVRRLLQGPPAARLKKLDELIELKQQELADLEAERSRLQEQLTPSAPPENVERVA